jgi:indole-3-glycerol phosphate synthase
MSRPAKEDRIMNILENILDHKHEEVRLLKVRQPVYTLKKNLDTMTRDFLQTLKEDGLSLIAELKPRSPSAGILCNNFDPVQYARVYEQHGASAISVLTDERFFGGSVQTISSVKNTLSLPVMRKDFIIDEYQIFESRGLGADAILLIASIVTAKQLTSFVNLATKLGMVCLVEVHAADEIQKVLSTPAQIIGVNNRNLDTLEVDPDIALRLRPLIPRGYITIAESGIKTRTDVRRLEKAGYDAVLVGESLMRSEYAPAIFAEFDKRSRQ